MKVNLLNGKDKYIERPNCWSIEINGVNYVGGWCGWKNEYKHQFDNWIVTKIKVSGGWYSFYDFHIECKEK